MLFFCEDSFNFKKQTVQTDMSGTYHVVTVNENGLVVSGSNPDIHYTLEQISVPGTYSRVTIDEFGRVISGENPTETPFTLPNVMTPGSYNKVTVNEKGIVVSGENPTETPFTLQAIGTPGTYSQVTTDAFGRVVAGNNNTGSAVTLPNKSFWYNCSKSQTPINTNTVVITNHIYPSYGKIGEIYFFYDNSTYPVTIIGKCTFEKEKNDIINWKYSFKNAMVSYLDGYTMYHIPNDPNLAESDYLSNTLWLYGNYYYQITLNEKYKLLPDGEHLTVFANGLAIGTITNSNQTIEYMSNVEVSLYVVPSSNLVFDIKLFLLSKYAESINVYPSEGWMNYFDGWPFSGNSDKNKGTWKIFATDSTFWDNIDLVTGSETVYITIDGVEVGSLTSANRNFEFDYNNNSEIYLSVNGYDETVFLSGFTPSVNFAQITVAAGGNESAIISTIDDTIIININNPYYTSSGTLVAEASLYDKDLNLKSVVDPIYLILELNDSQPSGC